MSTAALGVAGFGIAVLTAMTISTASPTGASTPHSAYPPRQVDADRDCRIRGFHRRRHRGGAGRPLPHDPARWRQPSPQPTCRRSIAPVRSR